MSLNELSSSLSQPQPQPPPQMYCYIVIDEAKEIGVSPEVLSIHSTREIAKTAANAYKLGRYENISIHRVKTDEHFGAHSGHKI